MRANWYSILFLFVYNNIKLFCGQRSSFFNCLLDMTAGQWTGNSKTGSLDPELAEEATLLSRRNTQHRSVRWGLSEWQ